MAEYSKQLPADFNVKWLRHEIVSLGGRYWADMRFVPTPKGVKAVPKDFKDYADAPLYTRFFGTSYDGQLLEIIVFTAETWIPIPPHKLAIDRSL